MVSLTALLVDLRAEGDELDGLVADLPADAWSTPTPAPGWTVAHQVAHLAWTDDQALLAATDGAAFQAALAEMLAAGVALTVVDDGAEAGAALPPAAILTSWRAGRDGLATALAEVPDGTKLPWYGPPMSPASLATARLMETWAHTNDVADALGVRRVPTARLRHVAHLGVRTMGFAFGVHGLVPTGQVRVELTPPDGGEAWTWGPDDAAQRVTGSALDFCLLVTQRVHRDDTDLVAVGSDADTWLGIAQAFAGPPGDGRKAAT